MYLQDSKLLRVCQVRNEDIDMSYVALHIICTTYVESIYLKQQYMLCIIDIHPINN